MKTFLWISIFAVTLGATVLSATGPDAKELAAKGHSMFIEVLGGDEAKFDDAVRCMEESRALDPANADNLYNLSRAYFYDGLTHRKASSLTKAEEVLNKLLEIKPEDTRALSFHGSLLTTMSQGKDIGMFMKGAQEMLKAVEKDPKNINNRIVIALTSQNFPPQALAAMGNYDNLKDLEFVRDAFAGKTFYYAPHAQVVMNAFVGESYKVRGDTAKARANFEAALAIPKPVDKGERAGRDLLDKAILTRLNGGEQTLQSGVFSGCHSCHLNAPDKIQR